MSEQQSYPEAEANRQPPEYAEKLYPQNTYLQDEWRRAIEVVRATSRGWILDSKTPRLQSK